MFGQWPHEILAVPLSEYRRLQRYYLEVRRQETAKPEESELPDGVTIVE